MRIILLAFFIFLQGSYSWAEDRPAKIDVIKERGYLIVAMLSTDTQPFIRTRKDGTLEGTDVKIAQLLAKTLGVGLKIDRSANTFDEIIDKVAREEADAGLSGLSITIKRAEKISYSHPYVHLNKAFLLSRQAFLDKRRKENASLQEFFSYGNKIGVIKGSSYEFYARHMFPKAKIVLYHNTEIDTKALDDLEKGKVDALFRDEFQVHKLIHSRYHGVLKYMAISLKDSFDPLGIVIDREALDFVSLVNIFLQVENISYTVDDLMKEYHQQQLREVKE